MTERPGRDWTLHLPFEKPPNLNDRGHRMAQYRIARLWCDAAITLARQHRIPTLDYFGATLHYAPRLNRVRDPENLTAAVKPLIDGLVRAGVAAGDDPRYYRPATPVIHPATGQPDRLWLIVREIHREDVPS